MHDAKLLVYYTSYTKEQHHALIHQYTNSQNKKNSIEKLDVGSPSPTGLYTFIVQFDDGPDMGQHSSASPLISTESCLMVHRAPYHLWQVYTIRALPQTYSTRTFYLPLESSPYNLSMGCKCERIITQVVKIEGIIPLFIRIRDLFVRGWFGIVESLPVELLLWTSSIDQCRGGRLPTTRKIVPLHSGSAENIALMTEINPVNDYATIFNVHINLQNDALSDELDSCPVLCQITIPSCLQVKVLVNCQRAVLMTIETHRSFFEHWCFMTARRLMGILIGKLIYAYISFLTAKQFNLPKFLIVASSSNAPVSIIYAIDDEQLMQKVPARSRHNATYLFPILSIMQFAIINLSAPTRNWIDTSQS